MKNNFSIQAIAWFFLTCACLLVIFIGLKVVLRKTGWTKERQQKIFLISIALISLWVLLLIILSLKGFFADFTQLPPRPALAMLLPLPIVLLVAFSKKGTALLRSVPQHWLVYLQSFRVIVELFLVSAFIAGRLPEQMTFEGRNFDIVTGVLALPVGYLLARGKTHAHKLAIVFNIMGLLLLLNIVVIAVLSMPTPIRYFMNEPANTIVAEFPFILLPGTLVPIAYSLHIFSLRQLVLVRKNENRRRPTGHSSTEKDFVYVNSNSQTVR